MEPVSFDEVRYTVTPEQRAAIVETLTEAMATRPEIVFAYLHGSFTEELPFRDIDVGVYLNESFYTNTDVLDYELEAAVHLQRQVGYPVDLRVINGAPLGFQFNVIRGQLLFCRDDEARFRFVEYTQIMYWDFDYLMRYSLSEVLK